MDQSYYDLLEVSKDASIDAIKKSWKKLAMKYHPDKQKTPQEKEIASEKFKKISEAYNVLSDPKKKELYDEFGQEGLDENGPRRSGGFGGMPPGFEDIFNMMHGGGGRQSKNQQPVPPIKVLCHATLEELYMGTIKKINIDRLDLCDGCDGTGSTDKKDYTCEDCKGTGMVTKVIQMGPMMIQQVQQPCGKCGRTGSSIKPELKCKKCDGNKVIPNTATIDVEIEKGMYEGEPIQVRNVGHELPKKVQDMTTEKRGIVVAIIKEDNHSIFERGYATKGQLDPSHLVVSIELSFAESLCGVTKKINHLDGTDMFYNTEGEIVSNGDIVVIKDKGMPLRQKSYKYGNLYIKFTVKKEHLPDEKKKQIYHILTGKEYNYDELHDHSDDVILLNNLIIGNNNNENNGNNSNNSSDSHDSDDDGPASGQGVDCATQ